MSATSLLLYLINKGQGAWLLHDPKLRPMDKVGGSEDRASTQTIKRGLTARGKIVPVRDEKSVEIW